MLLVYEGDHRGGLQRNLEWIFCQCKYPNIPKREDTHNSGTMFGSNAPHLPLISQVTVYLCNLLLRPNGLTLSDILLLSSFFFLLSTLDSFVQHLLPLVFLELAIALPSSAA